MTHHARKNGSSSARKKTGFCLPEREDILRFITENPGQSGKREIAKAFGLKGDARIRLKVILRELADKGLIEKRKKRIVRHGALPPVTLLDIFGRDDDGGLLARPAGWDGPNPPAVLIRPSRNAESSAAGVGERILARIFPSQDSDGPAYNGRVIRKIEKQLPVSILGVLRRLENGELRLEPADRKQPELVIDPQSATTAKPGDLVNADPVQDQRYGLKRGIVREIIGYIGGEKALSMIAIFAHGIPHVFPPAVLEEAESAKSAAMSGREDWRALPIVTIDPADAKDHDDAVFAEADTNPENAGGHIVTVAIADVAAYIHPGSAMDQEAYRRGNSVYFPDRVVPMLPERISNDLCSLREGEDRPALAVRMIFNIQGRKLRHSFHRVMIRPVAKLSYEQAQKAIDGVTDEKTAPILESTLKPLWAAYVSMRLTRDSRKPLELDLPEKKILLDSQGRIKDIHVPLRLNAHRLIEEFMIAANVAAAETLKAKKQPFIYRIHDQPSLAKQETLREFLRAIGMPLARGVDLTPEKFNTILAKAEGTEQQELINQVVLRAQSQAEYSPVNIGHFGLCLKNYTHYTSPIRRYADLIVHRALIKALQLGNDGITADEEKHLEDISFTISAAERRAMAAERDTIDRLIAHYLADQVGVSFEGRIAGVTRAGLFITLETYGADGLAPISTLGHEYYYFDEARHAIVGEKSRKGYQLGDIVTIRLMEAMPIAGALRFEMLSPPRTLPFSTRSYHKTGKHFSKKPPAYQQKRKR